MDEQKMQELVQKVLRHFTFVQAHDQNDKPLLVMTIDIDRKSTISRKVYLSEAELNLLGLDVWMLSEYMKNPDAILFKKRQGAAELRKAK